MSKNNWSQSKTDKLARVILGWKPIDNTFHPATNIRHAMMLVESYWFMEMGYVFQLTFGPSYLFGIAHIEGFEPGKFCWSVCINAGDNKYWAYGETPELAICNAILKLVEVNDGS